MSVLEDAREMAGELTRWRRDLHAHPEVGLDLPRTQEAVLAALDGLPVEIGTGTAATSVTAVLRGAEDGPPVLLRADMDAIPVQELTGLPYASSVPGVMHACGHDLHTAMLLGAAHLLTARREELPGDVVLMFQPGEEGWEGAHLHSPVQIAEPDANSCFCEDAAAARATRRRLLAEAAEERTLVVPAHFPGHGAAEVRARGAGYEVRRWAGFRPVDDGEPARSVRGGA